MAKKKQEQTGWMAFSPRYGMNVQSFRFYKKDVIWTYGYLMKKPYGWTCRKVVIREI